MSKDTLSLLSGLLVITAFGPLIFAVIKRGYRPPKSSWIIWGVLDTIIGIGMYEKGTLNGQMIGALIGVWTAIGVMLKYGTPGWTKSEKTQMVIAALGVVLWQILGDSNIGIATGCGLLVFGAWATFEDAWHSPQGYLGSENFTARLAWVLFWLSCLPQTMALGSISNWTFANAAQPMSFLLIESVMMYLIYIRAPQVVIVEYEKLIARAYNR